MHTGDDLNGQIAALLRDLAAVQPSERSGWGYKRAANAVLDLDRPIETLLQLDCTLEKIPNVGPKSETVILEFLEHGRSQTVEAAIEKGGKTTDITRRRGLRNNFLSRAQVLDALSNESLTGPSLSDYHGDLQMHSTWSDGGQSLDDIAEAALDRGYEFCALTDHSYGLPIANGLSMERLATQHRMIDRLNRKHRGRLRLIKGIEANIRKDGSVDMTAEERKQLEFILAAPHSSLRLEVDQTSRMIAAVRTPGVHVLGHPRALDSDAHSVEELEAAETAIAHARLAGVPAERIINCWPLARLLDWLGVK